MTVTSGSASEDTGEVAGRWRWWLLLGWLLLLCWVPPLVWQGWWWLLLVPLVPAQILGIGLMAAIADMRREAQRAATASSIAPGDPLDVRRRRRASASRSSSPNRNRLAPGAVAWHLAADVGQVRALAQHPKQAWLAVGGTEKRVRLWAGIDTTEPEPIAMLPLRGPLAALVFSPDGRFLATGAGGTVTVWDVTRPENPTSVLNLIHPDGCHSVPAVDLGPGGLLAFGSDNGQIGVWDLSHPGRPRRVGQIQMAPKDVPIGAPTGVFALRFSPDGTFLVTGGRPKSSAPALIWRLDDLDGPQQVAKLRPHRTSMFGMEPPMCHALAFSPRRPLLVTASEYDYWNYAGEPDFYQPQLNDGAVVIWDLRNPSRPRGLVTLGERGGDTPIGWRGRPQRATPTTLAGHADTARVLSISPDGTQLATGADDHHVLAWDITDPARPKHLATLTCTGPVHALAFTPDSRFLISAAGEEDQITIWNAPRTDTNR